MVDQGVGRQLSPCRATEVERPSQFAVRTGPSVRTWGRGRTEGVQAPDKACRVPRRNASAGSRSACGACRRTSPSSTRGLCWPVLDPDNSRRCWNARPETRARSVVPSFAQAWDESARMCPAPRRSPSRGCNGPRTLALDRGTMSSDVAGTTMQLCKPSGNFVPKPETSNRPRTLLGPRS